MIGKNLYTPYGQPYSFPLSLNLEISFYDFNTGVKTPIGKVNGVKKNQFSTYIELSNSSSPDELYIIDGTDLNGHKVLSIDDFSSGYISFDFDLNIGTVFVPNSIISMGIGAIPDDGVSTFHNPEVIFKRIAK